MTVVRRRGALFWFAALSALSLRANADASSQAAAESLFSEGRAAMARGEYDEACEKFEASNQLDPAVGTVFNLANCNERRGRRALALEQFREVAARLPASDPREPIASAHISDLAAHVPMIALRLGHAAPAGAVVVLDARPLPPQSLNAALPVDAGDHIVIVRAAEHADREYRVSLVDGQRVDLAVDAGEIVAEGNHPPDQAATRMVEYRQGHPPAIRSRPSRRVVAGAIVGGVGIATLGASVVTGIVALSKEHSLDGSCEDKPGGGGRFCNAVGLRAADSGRTFATVSDVTLGVGLAAAAVGAWLVFFPGSHHEVDMTAGAIPGGASLGVRGAL
ncbi:MAG TPA: hypothetical protein VH142_27775 [Polyangiaceae bacterium]|nr:hypothetical protein [Polyangiaceae bacterium]